MFSISKLSYDKCYYKSYNNSSCLIVLYLTPFLYTSITLGSFAFALECFESGTTGTLGYVGMVVIRDPIQTSVVNTGVYNKTRS